MPLRRFGLVAGQVTILSLAAWGWVRPSASVGEVPAAPRATEITGLSSNGPLPAAEAAPVSGVTRITLDDEALLDAGRHDGKVSLGDVRLPGNAAAVVLDLRPLRVVGPKTRVVVGQPDGVDVVFPFDASQVHVFQGQIRGLAESNVVLFRSPRRVTGHISLGGSGARYRLTNLDGLGRRLPPGQADVYPDTSGSGEPLPGVPLCGLGSRSTVAGCCAEPAPAPGLTFNKRIRNVEIAIETDYDLYENFNDIGATTDYIVELFARVNAIFLRDIDARFEVVFMRVFNNPAAEPAFMNQADPLNGYVSFWNTTMAGVARDTGTFLSGRRNLPYGGVAYLGGVCTNFGYCICGYLSGFPNPAFPNTGEYDVEVTAHELGHNFDACHTPDYCPQIDRCFPLPAFPQRGTLMSYCSQTVSGGDLVAEDWYHTRLRRVMRNFIELGASCVSYDCNQNGEDDALDISGGASLDTNGNGVPDECEDCNANGVLDPTDISLGTSTDLNANAVPDDCEPDCNANAVPDDLDISLGTSLDAWGNGVPDECDPDCDGDGTPDYNEIQINLALDIDRNVVLDACQDCDNDGINDLVELSGARNAWVASDVLNYIGEYHAVSGARVKISTVGQVSGPQDLIITPSNRVLVTSSANNRVVSFDAITGAYLGDLVAAGSGGLSFPTGLILAPNGNLLVSSRNTNSVLQYDGTSGASLGAFVAAGAGGLISPFGLTFGPNGNLFVTSNGNQVLEFNGANGSFVRTFVSSGNNGGLNQARGLLFKPDGNLLAASYLTDAILHYDATTGASLGKWNSGGTTSALYLDGPWGLRLGPNGNVFCTRDLPAVEDGDHDHEPDTDELHVTSVRVLEFEIANGKYKAAFVVGDDTGLRSPTGFAFMPGTGDCNWNMLQDDCDIALCSGDPACGDCNFNTLLDGCDLAEGNSVDGNANALPDECEPPPDPIADPQGEKTRGLSFSAPAFSVATGSGPQTAIRVTMIDLQNPQPPNAPCCPPPDFGSFEAATCTAPGESNNCARWVGRPGVFLESQDSPSAGAFKAARLQCTPYYHDWSGEGVVHVGGGEVAPSSAFDVQVLTSNCKGNEDFCTTVSNPVRLLTRRAGDIAAPFNPPSTGDQPDALDVSAGVDKFKNLPGAASKAVAQQQPNVPDLNADLSALDVASVVDNFRGLAYPFSGPCACPSTVLCGAAACTADADCNSGLCVRECVSGPNTAQPCTTNGHCGQCLGGVRAGYPCDDGSDCAGSACTVGLCGPGSCKDRCGRCNPSAP